MIKKLKKSSCPKFKTFTFLSNVEKCIIKNFHFSSYVFINYMTTFPEPHGLVTRNLGEIMKVLFSDCARGKKSPFLRLGFEPSLSFLTVEP